MKVLLLRLGNFWSNWSQIPVIRILLPLGSTYNLSVIAHPTSPLRATSRSYLVGRLNLVSISLNSLWMQFWKPDPSWMLDGVQAKRAGAISACPVVSLIYTLVSLI